jgi:hypothetical protein
MKKIFTISALAAAFSLQAQFTVSIQAPADFKDQDAILYTLNGSKDIIVTKEQSKNNVWTFKYPKNYMGMMKVYFPNSPPLPVATARQTVEVFLTTPTAWQRVATLYLRSIGTTSTTSHQTLSPNRETHYPPPENEPKSSALEPETLSTWPVPTNLNNKNTSQAHELHPKSPTKSTTPDGIPHSPRCHTLIRSLPSLESPQPRESLTKQTDKPTKKHSQDSVPDTPPLALRQSPQ